MEPKIDAALPNLFGGPYSGTVIPRVKAGETPDKQPIFEDLGNDDYEFRLALLAFRQFEAQVPPQPKPAAGVGTRWSLACTYPLKPSTARYDMSIATNKPPPYELHRTLPLFFPERDQKPAPFAPGLAPPSDQDFTL